jgi:hypothetical protein
LQIVRSPSGKVLSGPLFCSVCILPGRRFLIRYPLSPNDVLSGLSPVDQDANPQVSGFCLVCFASGSCRGLSLWTNSDHCQFVRFCPSLTFSTPSANILLGSSVVPWRPSLSKGLSLSQLVVLLELVGLDVVLSEC